MHADSDIRRLMMLWRVAATRVVRSETCPNMTPRSRMDPMHRRTLWLMMVVTAGSTLVCGAIKSTRAQSVDSAVLPTNYVDSGYAGDDTTASRLPTAGDGTVSSLTALEGGTNARIAALEAKIAELNASLQNAPDKPKRYIVG